MAPTTNTTASFGLEDHPAVAAWRRGPALGQPSHVEALKETVGRSVYLLAGVSTTSGEVIAKRSPAGTLDVEQLFYDEVLPGLDLPALRCLGLRADCDGINDWLFVEVAGGDPFSPVHAEHRALAGELLGRLHQFQPPAPVAARLPRHEPIPYREYMERTRDGFADYLSNRSVPIAEVALINALTAQLERIVRLHSQIADLRAALPPALVHGDFMSRNARVEPRGGRLALLAFDWQDAGWGTPEMDLALAPLPSRGFAGNPAVHHYWRAVRQARPELDFQIMQRVANLATLFRCLASLSWDVPGLGNWGPRVTRRLQYYHAVLAIALQPARWES